MTKSVEIIPKGSTLTIGTLMEAVSYDDMIHSSQMANVGLNAMYPATMLNFGFLSRNVAEPEKYRQIRDERIVLKRNGDSRQNAYKIVLT